ncbi:MAG: DUF1549 domain-containing protein [Planctomycetes bacterium]|nr:DUF1549 domain-containing protein [Planctomycetota bacterium]
MASEERPELSGNEASMFRMLNIIVSAVILGFPVAASPSLADSPTETARRVDQALLKDVGKSAALPAQADDATFLRRVCLDLTGKLPEPELAKSLQAGKFKRALIVEQLLASEAFAVNWGRYWRDVLTYHSQASNNSLRWELFDRWLTDQVREGRSFSDMVTSMVTATGINDEVAPVNFLTSHFGNPIEIGATVSRVFLGVQLQCAQCHDAKNEPWKREQFHEFVAFFGRAKLIQHKDVNGRGTPYAIDGRAEGQYAMPDLKNPDRLIALAPRFLGGDAVSADLPDLERRAALAKQLTKSPWFAKAYVNRMWTALMGWGFYPGLADLGTDVEPRYPEVLDLLAREWAASGHDMRWLFRTITATQAYQRQLQPRPDSESTQPVAVCPQRLRPEQIFENLVRALGFDEKDKKIPAPAPSAAPAARRHEGLRHMVYMAFKFDPSLSPGEVQGTIPQALLMMNSVLVNTYVAASGKTFLAEALEKNMADDELIVALYQRTLARSPRGRELETCRRYLRTVNDRREAFEDIFWSLLNSTEFVTKR